MGFPTAVLKEKQHAVFDGYVSMVYKKDFHLLNDEDAEKVQYTLENTRFVRTVLKTDRDFDDPKLLSSALNWAKRNSVSVRPPFYISYLTELVDAGEKSFLLRGFSARERSETIINREKKDYHSGNTALFLIWTALQ